MFLDSFLIWLLLVIGFSVFQGFLVIAILAVGFFIYDLFVSKNKSDWNVDLAFKKPSILEGVILVFILEKTLWGLYNLANLPVYFDDALNHWSGRGKALLDGSNWSWDPTSIYFMGKAFGNEQYPLFASIWRATNAALLGRHDAGLERVDGFLLWLVLLIVTTYWIKHYTQKRWLGLLGAAIIAAIPLQTWHNTSGYVEVYIQAYLLLSLYCLFQNKYILAGLFSAAMIWSKNEGLVLFVPSVMACVAIKLYLEKSTPLSERTKCFLRYNLSWLLVIAPWIIFKLIKGIGFTIPSNQGLGYIDGAMSKMIGAIYNSPSSSILWMFFSIAIIFSMRRIVKSNTLLPLAIGCLILLAMMTFLFTSTGSYQFLENQSTIHRSLLQIAPPFVILCCLSLMQKKEVYQAA